MEGLCEVALLLRTLCETVVEGDQVGPCVCVSIVGAYITYSICYSICIRVCMICTRRYSVYIAVILFRTLLLIICLCIEMVQSAACAQVLP